MKDKEKRPDKLSVAGAREVLKELNLRGTAARIAVVQCLADSKTPLSHAEVTDKLGELGFDSSTIFRSLTELSDAGLFRRVDLGDGARRFEFAPQGEASSEAHPHFLCLDCGKITCLPGYTFELHAITKGAVRANQVTEVLLKGHCSECS
jgi:Fur family ferric uptake transcriptional regulator